MRLAVYLSCGEVNDREVGDSPEWERQHYIYGLLGGYSRNSKGEFVTVERIIYGDIDAVHHGRVMLKICNSDLFEVGHKTAMHDCSCLDATDKGIVSEIEKRHCSAHCMDMSKIKGGRFKLGGYSMAREGGVLITNAYTQYTYLDGSDMLKHNALKEVLDSTARNGIKEIVIPSIGLGFTNDDIKKIVDILRSSLLDIRLYATDDTIYASPTLEACPPWCYDRSS